MVRAEELNVGDAVESLNATLGAVGVVVEKRTVPGLLGTATQVEIDWHNNSHPRIIKPVATAVDGWFYTLSKVG